jgi:SulP family sulfate permease
MHTVISFILEWPKMFVPFRAWLGELRDPSVLRADIIAGITVALVLVPQSMAYAQLAGLPAYHGLYASFLPVMIAALFGSSRQLATGPVAIVSLMTASTLEPYITSPETYIAYAMTLALLVGVFQIMLGLLRMGILVDFLSHPVVIGFTNAACIIIATSQIGKLVGVSAAKEEHHYEHVYNTIRLGIENAHGATILMSVLALSLMYGLKSYLPRIPGVLVAVVITTLVSFGFGYEEMGGRVVGNIPEGLPGLALPSFNIDVIRELIPAAVAISLIGFMEAISIAKVMAARTRQRLSSNQELVGQGMGNLAASFFQGYAVSGSFSRSAVNIAAGAKTGFSSVITGLVVALTLLFLTPLLYHLPQATLASVIIMAVVNLVKVGPIIHAWKVQKSDAVISVIVFLLTLYLAPHLETGLFVGVGLSIFIFLLRSMRPIFVEVSRHEDGTLRDAEEHHLAVAEEISVFRFDMPLYFANAGYLEDMVLESIAKKPDLKYVILDMEPITIIDATGEEVLHALTTRLRDIGIDLLISRTKHQVQDVFDESGFTELLGKGNFFRTRNAAITFALNNLGIRNFEESPLNPDMSGYARGMTDRTI